ncbi:MAG: hypothetical protein GQ570_05500 [Helicobacteraceae bacterium]|nr:hypothetical protein [Helicobacteraceae bacterium]
MFKKILIISILVIISVAVVFDIWYFSKIYNWPIWIGITILVGLIGIILAGIFFRRYSIRNNERNFVKRVIAKESDSIIAKGENNSLMIEDLEEHWESSISLLNNSKLNKNKNSIYELPWFLVIGESNSGKTSLIKNSHLSSAVVDMKTSTHKTETLNCDWWFFEDSIILDTAGRYTIPIEEARDNNEWERFLTLLSKERKKEPLNGLVITVPANRLLENDLNIIEEDALNIRKNINELMLSIGVKFPVYFMITKMDMIYGFSHFSSSLPLENQSQAMGYMNESLNKQWEEVLTDTIDFIKSKITSLQLLIIKKDSSQAKELLLFAEEFDYIIPALQKYTQIIFGDNPYQKIPMLRGIYFSSALSDTQNNSKFLSKFNLSQEESTPKNRSFFITDFFKTILPNDRNVFTPITEYLDWQRKSYRIALISWILVFSSLVGVYTFSFIKNIDIINEIAYIKKHNGELESMDLTSRILYIDRLRLNVKKINELNENIFLPFLSFEQSHIAANSIKELFVKDFHKYLWNTFANKMYKSIDTTDENTASLTVINNIGFMMYSIHILEQVLDGKQNIEFNKNFRDYANKVFLKEENQIVAGVSELFIDSYISFLKWSSDTTIIKENISILQTQLDLIIEKKGTKLYWLTNEDVTMTASVHISDFWKGIDKQKALNAPRISGSLTEKGRLRLIRNIEILESIISNPKEFKENLKGFWEWYDDRFYYRWKIFALAFDDGKDFLLKNSQYDSTLYSMVALDNPYFTFIHKMAKELKAYKPLKTPPLWTQAVIELDEVISVAKDIKNSKNSFLEKVNNDKNTLIAKVESATNNDKYISQINAATIFNVYTKDLSELSTVSDKKISKLLTSNFFSEIASAKESGTSFNKSENDYKKFIHALPHYENDKFIYSLAYGPLNFIINYSVKQMSTILNTQWDSEVLGSLPMSSDHNLLMSLFEKEKGLVWKFEENYLKSFLSLNQYGYSVKSVSGYKIDINPSFLSFLNSGINILSIYKEQYPVDITTFPSAINKDAKEEPNYINLRLKCAKEDYTLEDNNYLLSKKFIWSPTNCGETTLTFGFNNFELNKIYEGADGFLHFLKEFRDGTQTFSKKDFAENTPELATQNIKWIKVRYNIKGVGSMLRLLDKEPYAVPKQVAGK